MRIVRSVLRIAFIVSLADFVIEGTDAMAIAALGIACVNIGIMIGERSGK